MILLNDLKNIIEANVYRYPKMQPQDVVKLIQQHVFGDGNKLDNKDVSFDFLKKEYMTIKYSHQGEDISLVPFSEDIGNWYSRVNLLAIKDEEELETLCDTFIATSAMGGGDLEYFLSRLYLIHELTDLGMFSFTEEELYSFLDDFEKQGYPLLCHSVIYKEFYDPAYRIIDSRYIRLFPLITRIRKMLSENGRVVVALDGRMGAGKTLAAEFLSFIFDASVIHMDDFFLPPEKCTRERMLEVGGNIHYERFRDEAARFIKKKEDFTFRPFNPEIMDYDKEIFIANKPVMIVEGTYSQHIEYRSIYDLKVFFDIDPYTQREYIYANNNEQLYATYKDIWIPLEEKYFEASEIQDKSHIIIN